MNLLLALLLTMLLPSLEDGRITPKENAHCLPAQFQPERWYELERLENPENFTLFSDQAYRNLRKAYLSENEKQIEETYWVAYEEIAGKRLHLTSHSVLLLPTIWELKVEKFYLSFPWTLALSLGFCFTLIFPRVFLLPYLLLTADLAIRLLLLKRAPVTNMAETYLWVSFVGATFAWIFRDLGVRRGASTLCMLLFGGLYFFEEKIALSLPPPVLNSNFWLTIHVLMVVGSYAFFFLAGLLAHFYVLKPKENVFRPLPPLLYGGVIALIAGTLLGGVWAHVSWGRFWDWDPKEAWAFISSLYYLLLVHLYRFKKIGPFGLSMGAIAGLIVITFTWYGVNYLLGVGLHSYGFGKGRWVPYLLFVLFESLFLAFSGVLSLTRKRQRDKNRREICG